MGHVRYSGHVDGTEEAAWDLVTRSALYPEWDPLFCRVTPPAMPLDRPGASIDAVLRMAGRQISGHVEVAAAEPPDRLLLVGVAGEDVRLTWTWRVARLGRGIEVSVELDYELAEHIAGDVADLVFVERAVGRGVRAAVENLADLVQVRQPVLVDS
ncbi:MAG TPA: SRPBCC family protein [Candidatus Limnocylindrales bacterium]